jgi:hypothetical protein
MRLRAWAVGLFALWLAATGAAAQDDAAAPANRVAEALATVQAQADAVAPGAAELRHLDEAGFEALRDSLVAYYRYRESGFQHRRAVFDWQLLSARIIFAVVILLVLAGVYFSWLQFVADRRAPRRAPEAAEGEEAPERRGLVTSFKAGAGGVEVSSPVLGVIILALSLAFFYLYLVHIYPIAEIF